MDEVFASLPRMGDIIGDPFPGHKVEVIHAAVLVYADGSEGLVSLPSICNGKVNGRWTFCTSDEKELLPMLKHLLARVELPEGGRIEWRQYRRG